MPDICYDKTRMTRPRRAQFRSWVIAACLGIGVGCQDNRGPVSIHSHDPDLEIVAMKRDEACPTHDQLAQMVDDLKNDDPAIRFYAIQSLRRFAHEDFGYRFYEDEDQRSTALKRWQNWMKGQ
jgi:hypothetical protein